MENFTTRSVTTRIKERGVVLYGKEISVLIDTTSNQLIRVGLMIAGEMDMREEQHETKKAQIVLPLLEELLAKHHLQMQDITAITVVPGSGSFTGCG